MPKQQKKQRKQKDLAEKKLLDCNDVFADIINAVVFQGKSVIRPEDLREVHPVSAYSEALGKGKDDTLLFGCGKPE